MNDFFFPFGKINVMLNKSIDLYFEEQRFLILNKWLIIILLQTKMNKQDLKWVNILTLNLKLVCLS